MELKRFFVNMVLFFNVLPLYASWEEQGASGSFFSVHASYKGDCFGNMSGGMRTGVTYLGYAQMWLGFSTEGLGLWNGGEFRAGGANVHGGAPTAAFVGDCQVLDNIEGDKLTYLEYLWYQQRIGRFTVKAGLQDLNENFVSSGASGEFINSSFGMFPVLAMNMPLAVFPITALAVEVHCDLGDRWHMQVAAYDGSPTSVACDPYNVKWTMGSSEGMLAAFECQYNQTIAGKEGSTRVGVFHHSAQNSTAVYGAFEQTLCRHGGRSFTPFLQTSALLDNVDSTADFHFAAGISLDKVFSKGGRDAAGIAFSMLRFNNDGLKTETAVEFFYGYRVNDFFFLKLDLQYIVNPYVTNFEKVDGAFAGILRFQFEI